LKKPAICYLLLAHLSPAETERLVERWRTYCEPPSQLLLCYGGTKENFAHIASTPKIFIDDPHLRTRRHHQEKQSYSQIFRQAARWLRDNPGPEYFYFAEFDHWPVVKDLGNRLVERLEREKADVLGHQLARRDRTSCVHYLYHLHDERFLPWLRQVSRRADPEAVFNMFGSGSFWTREAFLAVAETTEPFPIYLEVYLPTLAHHLGFRIRDFQEQNRFISDRGDRHDELALAAEMGAWTIHPVKTFGSETSLSPPSRD
jgi:hypothetical protein